MNPVVLETMNDILNQVETREWKRVTQQRDVLMRKTKRQCKQIESMEDDWAVATEKLAQENSDLHNEIKRLKSKSYGSLQSERKIFAEREVIFRDEIKKLKDELRVKHPVIFQKTYQQQRDEIKKLKDEIENLKSSLMNSSGSFNCDKCRIHLTEDDVYRSVDSGELICESCAEGDDSDSDSDDDELDECFCCEKRFDSHNARYNMGESLRLKYEKYYGSENDDGDICPECINKNY